MLNEVQILGFSIPDIVGLGLGFMAAVLSLIALSAAVIIFFLGVRHSRHLKEIEIARRELLDSTVAIREDIDRNSALLKEVHLGFNTINSLLTLQSQHRLIAGLEDTDEQLGVRAATELKNLENRMKARELELQIIVSEGQRCRASLLGLSQTFGDHQTIEFLRAYALILEARGVEAHQFHETRGGTSARLMNLKANQ
ncbi:hypothetical protein FIV00_00115 [Labrenzia sp. THAF82]|uniref:hypothetical protein n=1 Tax=Labrenzia sp. THAF82 TaxID=2587861 RepID=UPI001267AE64|nr:hypothetical protein [Labrenzia sp. THAF82]QFT28878.1 hypothetical protein FIV00_00115 [Labrenzia sp. THAF82]